MPRPTCRKLSSTTVVFAYGAITHYGRPFQTVPLTQTVKTCWLVPCSLATTYGISVDFCSSGYLDVSVHRVRLLTPYVFSHGIPLRVGFPIRTSPDQSLFASSPELFAGYHVLHRL